MVGVDVGVLVVSGIRVLCLTGIRVRCCLCLLQHWLCRLLRCRLHLPLPVNSQNTLNVRLKLLLIGQRQNLTAVVTGTVVVVLLRAVQTLGTVGMFVFHPSCSLSFCDGWGGTRVSRGTRVGVAASSFLCPHSSRLSRLGLIVARVTLAGFRTVAEIAAIVRQVLFHFVRHAHGGSRGDEPVVLWVCWCVWKDKRLSPNECVVRV